MTAKKFILALLIALLVAQTRISISTMRTDIGLLESQGSILTDEVASLKIEQERINSRLRYTVTVLELETVIARLEDIKTAQDKQVTTHYSLNEILKNMFGKEVWGE